MRERPLDEAEGHDRPVDWWAPIVAVVGAVVVLWLSLVVVVLVGARDRVRLGEALRLLPDLVRLLTRLARDPAAPRRVRWVVVALVAYLALPLDLIPDVLPGIGYLDDIVIVALVLRWVARTAGVGPIERNWPGSDQGRAAVVRLLGLVP